MSLMRRKKKWPFDVLDDIFEDFWKPSSFALMQFPELSIPRIQFPRLDIKEGANDYTVVAEVPGYSNEDIIIEIKDNTLIISSEASDEKEEEREGYVVRERSQRSFSRLIGVPKGTTAEDISANLDKGLLTIKITKKEPLPPKKIPITSTASSEGVKVEEEKK